MRMIWALIILFALAGIAGRIDYETALDMQAFRKEYAQNFHNRRAAAQEAK